MCKGTTINIKKWGEKANYSHNFSTFAPKTAYKRRKAIII